MSHFSVLVITDEKPTEDVLARILQPWHEFECTGMDDEYVKNIDLTAKARKEYENSKANRYVDPDGKQHDPYEDRFYRDPTPEEEKVVGGTGFGNGIAWHSRDWGDGRGYRTKVQFLPEGWTKISVPIAEVESFEEWASGYYGGPIIREDESHKEDIKYGHILVKKDGTVRVIDRTNPSKKWDWWQVGGRFSGALLVKEGAPGWTGQRSWTNETAKIVGLDQARRGDLDLAAMKKQAEEGRRKWAQDCCAKAHLSMGDLDTACRIKPLADEEWRALPDPKPRGNDYHAWLREHGGDWPTLATFEQHCWDLPDVPKNMSLEEWIADAPPLGTWAVVLDNQWFEHGEMGWWGMSSNDKHNWDHHFNELFEIIKEDQFVSVVDCHI